MNTFKIYEQLKPAFPQPAAEALAHVLSELADELRAAPSESDFDELKTVVRALGEAQQATEQRLAALTERVDRLTERLDALTERVDALTVRMDQLTQAQLRTEQRLDQLARTMEQGFRLFGLRLEALFSRAGSSAEAAFREGLREIVREAGYTVESFQGQDPTGYINHDPGRSYDLDILVRDGSVIAVEIKSSVGSPDLVRFSRTVSLFEQQTGRRVTKRVMIAASIRPEARQRAAELGIILGIDTTALDG